MKRANDIVTSLLGVLLIIAAVLKGWQLLAEPIVDDSIWTSRPFLILQVELELALGIWLFSGLFKKAAWLAALSCFGVFSLVTLYKGITGAESCGCFGKVHVNPWITLFAIDLPAVIALALFRPGLSFRLRLSFLRKWESVKPLIADLLTPAPSLGRFTITTCLILITLGVTAPILAFNEPAKVTSSYEVLEPETWVGKELPILEHIDIAKELQKGTWLILLYHYDCPGCGQAIPMYEQMARDLAGSEDFLRIALIAVPPYGQGPVSEDSSCTLGRLAETKEWFVTTPAVVLLKNGQVTFAWEAKAPDLGTVLHNMAKMQKTREISLFLSTISLTHAPKIERR